MFISEHSEKMPIMYSLCHMVENDLSLTQHMRILRAQLRNSPFSTLVFHLIEQKTMLFDIKLILSELQGRRGHHDLGKSVFYGKTG